MICPDSYFEKRFYSQMDIPGPIIPSARIQDRMTLQLGGWWISELFTELKVLKSPTVEIAAVRKTTPVICLM